MFTVTVRDHMMVAHSLTGADFGPAQRLHGATYVVDAAFSGNHLGPEAVLVDIARATFELQVVLGGLTYRNLDEEPEFLGTNTTTEVLAREVADRLVDRIAAGELGDASRVERITVTLHESHVAWASYERPL